MSHIIIEDYTGNVDVSYLIPKIGSSFLEIDELIEAVTLLEDWQFKSALREVDQLIESQTKEIDALLLKAEILGLFDANQASADVCLAVLEKDEENIFALMMLLIQLVTLKTPQEKLQPYLQKLKTLSTDLHDKFVEVLAFIQKHNGTFDFMPPEETLDLICVYGYFFNEDGSMPKELEVRLLKVVELAQLNPEATILLSGGAVQNQYGEAVEMKKHLIKMGIKEDRLVALEKARDTVGNIMEFVEYIKPRNIETICAVSSFEHLPRAWMALYTGLKRINYPATVFGASPQGEVNEDTLKNEEHLSYQTVFRVAGLYEKKDIASQL